MAKKPFRFTKATSAQSHPKLKKGPNMKKGGEQDQMGLIYGVKPDSMEEWRVAVALWNLGKEFDFQVPFFGGHEIGGFVVDFVVHDGLDIPIEIIGEYWHRNVGEEEHRAILLQAEMQAELVYLITTFLQTQEEATAAVAQAIAN